MSRSDIKAGRAYVELYVKNSMFVKGLRSASQRIKAFGGQLSTMGSGMIAAGASIAAPLIGAVKHFVSVGDALDKMSARTGASVGTLAELGFAAEQSGASLENVEAVMLKMNRRLGRATAIGGPAADAIEKLGLNLDEIRAMNPEQRFLALGEAVKNYGDDAAAAGLAQKALGTGVDKLLPLFKAGKEGIEALRAEARKEGLVPSEKATAAAAKLGDAFNIVYRKVQALVFEIGAALAPTLTAILGKVKEYISVAQDWAKRNQGLIQSVFKFGAALGAAGAALLGAGSIVSTIGTALGGLASTIVAITGVAGSFVAAIGAVLSPMGLAVGIIGTLSAALLTAGGVWLYYSGVVGQAVAFIQKKVQQILEYIKPVTDGIRDAVNAGELLRAATIAWRGIEIATREGLIRILDAIAEFVPGTRDAFGELTWKLVEALDQVLPKVYKFAKNVIGVFRTVALGINDVFSGVLKGIVRQIAKVRDSVLKFAAVALLAAGQVSRAASVQKMMTDAQALDKESEKDITHRKIQNSLTIEDSAANAHKFIDKLDASDLAGSLKEQLLSAFDDAADFIEDLPKAQREAAAEARAALMAEIDAIGKAKKATSTASEALPDVAGGVRGKKPGIGTTSSAQSLQGFSVANIARQLMPQQRPEERLLKNMDASLSDISREVQGLRAATTIA